MLQVTRGSGGAFRIPPEFLFFTSSEVNFKAILESTLTAMQLQVLDVFKEQNRCIEL